MFVDLYVPNPLPVDRDAIQEALEGILGDRGEVVGAGVGATSSNLDLELFEPLDRDGALRDIAATLDKLGLSPDTILAMSDTGERVSLGRLLEG